MNCKVNIEILIFAFRYALNRQTSAPSIVIENIKVNIDEFKKWQIEIIIKEIEEANLKPEESYMFQSDYYQWIEFQDYLKGVLNDK